MEKNKTTGRRELLNLSSNLFEDAITYEKVHRHLRDINDTITEEDIKNVRTDIAPFDRNIAGEKDNPVNPVASKNESSEKEMAHVYEEGKKITSPWNIVSE